MILIWGFRYRAKNVGSGQFFCSSCGADRAYVVQQIRRWFTLFFLPLFPVGKPRGEQVKCTTCGSAFRPDVLGAPTSAQLSENLRGATRVASVAMLAAGDRNSAPARLAAVEASKRTGADSYDETWLNHDLVALDPSQLGEYLAPLERGLTPQGKESFVEQVARVGLADGPLGAGEMQVLESLSTALGLSAAHLRGIVMSAAGAQESPAPGDRPPDGLHG